MTSDIDGLIERSRNHYTRFTLRALRDHGWRYAGADEWDVRFTHSESPLQLPTPEAMLDTKLWTAETYPATREFSLIWDITRDRVFARLAREQAAPWKSTRCRWLGFGSAVAFIRADWPEMLAESTVSPISVPAVGCIQDD